jgi:streptogramin lyase
MTIESPFQPRRGANQKVTATTTSQTITIGAGSKSIRALNAGAVVGYFVTYKASDETRTCTAADTPVGPAGAASSTMVIEKPQDHDTVAYLADSTTAVMHFQPGEGGC